MSYALVDIGNTSLKAKVFKGKTEAYSCTLGTDPRSLALFFAQLKIKQYLISSVVPSLNEKIQELAASKAYFLTHEHFLDLKVLVKNSQTPKGLNEQAVKELRKLGFYKSLNKTANSVLNRLKKSK